MSLAFLLLSIDRQYESLITAAWESSNYFGATMVSSTPGLVSEEVLGKNPIRVFLNSMRNQQNWFLRFNNTRCIEHAIATFALRLVAILLLYTYSIPKNDIEPSVLFSRQKMVLPTKLKISDKPPL